MVVDIFNTDKKYRVIYADPPWKYGSKQLFREKGIRFHALENWYDTMGISELKALNVKRLTTDDCALFMWSTDSHIPEAIELMKAWGFKYVTVAFTWIKVSNKGNLVKNLSPWTLKSSELCLFGTKGRMRQYKQCHTVEQVFTAERTTHSKKPDCVYGFIEKLFGDVPRLELFARQEYPGGDCWGNEV